MKYLVIDIESLFWAHALSGAPPYDVARSVVRQIRDLAKDFDRVVCACGGHEEGRPPCTGTSFRAVFWPEYKANRKDRAEAMWRALAGLLDDVRAEGWTLYEAPERDTPESDGRAVFYEADDVIATVAAYLESRDHHVVIRSDDSDLAQCVTDRVWQFRKPKTGNLLSLNPAGVEAWLGVPPSQVADLKAVGGDSTDGYKPIPSVAEGNAKKMLAAVPSHRAADLRAYCEAIPEKDRSKLHLAVLEHYTPEVMRRAYLAAYACPGVPLDLDALEGAPVRVPLPVVAAGLIPDADFVPVQIENAGQTADPTTALTVRDTSARMLAAPEESFRRMQELQAFVQRCMVPGVDWEKYSWTPKPILLKPGAEKLAEIYGLAPTFEIEKAKERWSATPPLFYYRVRCKLFRKGREGEQVLVAECIGSCNSWESKYRDRWVFESDIPPDVDRSRLERKEFTSKAGKTFFKYKLANPDFADIVNTVLKMAQKRSFTGAVIIATRSGGVFGQDLDTLPASAFGEYAEGRQWEM